MKQKMVGFPLICIHKNLSKTWRVTRVQSQLTSIVYLEVGKTDSFTHKQRLSELICMA